MKLGPRLLVEIMKVVQEGLTEFKDISEMLRGVEVASYIQLRRGGY